MERILFIALILGIGFLLGRFSVLHTSTSAYAIIKENEVWRTKAGDDTTNTFSQYAIFPIDASPIEPLYYYNKNYQIEEVKIIRN